MSHTKTKESFEKTVDYQEIELVIQEIESNKPQPESDSNDQDHA